MELTAACIKEAWDHGINTFDTAEVYGEGNSEIVMGKALKQLNLCRDDYVLTTKLHFGDGNGFPNNHGLSRKHIIEGMKRSLHRLQMDHVDIVFCHRSDFWATPMEETVRAMNTLIDHGHAHYW